MIIKITIDKTNSRNPRGCLPKEINDKITDILTEVRRNKSIKINKIETKLYSDEEYDSMIYEAICDIYYVPKSSDSEEYYTLINQLISDNREISSSTADLLKSVGIGTFDDLITKISSVKELISIDGYGPRSHELLMLYMNKNGFKDWVEDIGGNKEFNKTDFVKIKKEFTDK